MYRNVNDKYVSMHDNNKKINEFLTVGYYKEANDVTANAAR